MVNMAQFYYFSPTGGTKKTGKIFCEAIAENIEEIDLGAKSVEVKQPEGEVTVVAAPVFGGRVPALVTDKLRTLNGDGKKAVTLAVYGTRAYEDALLELNRTLEEQGFVIAASAALVAQHSIVPEVGAGRPDEKDTEEIKEFAKKVLSKLEGTKGDIDSKVEVPGNYPYKDEMTVAAPPMSLPSCTACGKCTAVCPTDAISIKERNVETSLEKCILCMACKAACPEHARILPPPLQEAMNQKLGALKDVRRENEFYL